MYGFNVSILITKIINWHNLKSLFMELIRTKNSFTFEELLVKICKNHAFRKNNRKLGIFRTVSQQFM